MQKNRNCIIRLSKYKNSLYRLRDLGFVRVFSDNLADAAGGTSVQVRKDFSLFGITGTRRGGYEVEELIQRLNSILGKDRIQDVIVVGAGHIGGALFQYKGFQKEGIRIVAAFDIDPHKHSTEASIPVLALDQLKDFVLQKAVRIGIIAVPDIAAQQALDLMISAGIRGVLNFAPIRLKAPDEVIVNNVNLEVELENLIYFVNTLRMTGTSAADKG